MGLDDRESGFSLIEVLIAAGILVVVSTTMAWLLAMGAVSNAASMDLTRASLLASDKMEQLRSLAFGDPALAPSPAGSLDGDVDGYFDAIDGRFVRRWSIEPLAENPAGTIVIQVVVTPVRGRGKAGLVAAKSQHAR